MKIYADTANLADIKEVATVGLVDGITTNPSLIAKEPGGFMGTIKHICDSIDVPVHVEVLSENHEDMVTEAISYHSISPMVVIKIPMTYEGLKAVHILNGLKIPTNVTLIFSAAQAILAIKAGANHICPFLGRLDDISFNGVELLKEIRQIQEANQFTLKFNIVAASIRSPIHVVELAKLGINILTIPTKVIKQMEKHPLTDAGIVQFNKDAKKFKTNNE